MDYLREKVSAYEVNLEYLFPVNQTFCHGEQYYPHPERIEPSTTPSSQTTPSLMDEEQDLYFAEDSLNDTNDNEDALDGEDLSPLSVENTLQ